MRSFFIEKKQFMMVTQKNETSVDSYLPLIERAIASGVTSVQLREKKSDFNDLKAFAHSLQALLKHYQAPFIINDSLDLAHQIDADGVHLGQTDGCPKHARALLGQKKIIGLTVNTLEEVILANELPIDYIGVGAIFKTLHKPDVKTIWGLDGLHKVMTISKHPIVAIGGIDLNNLQSVIDTHVHGIAAIGLFTQNQPSIQGMISKHKGNHS
jgi:thiamine-phosphate pyrophosphorylase